MVICWFAAAPFFLNCESISILGSEWDYVLLSTVRSLPEIEIERRPSLNWKRKNLGFVADPHQINVAITRARKGLIIVGKITYSSTYFKVY